MVAVLSVLGIAFRVVACFVVYAAIMYGVRYKNLDIFNTRLTKFALALALVGLFLF